MWFTLTLCAGHCLHLLLCCILQLIHLYTYDDDDDLLLFDYWVCKVNGNDLMGCVCFFVRFYRLYIHSPTSSISHKHPSAFLSLSVPSTSPNSPG